MSKLGIVGPEAAKFTKLTEQAARQAIHQLFTQDVKLVVSGGCHLSGIDQWAIEAARAAGLPNVEFKPQVLEWETGYKTRNLLIAQHCDRVVCITVRTLPERYKGLRFDWCYHCRTGAHVKSGGCWTMKQAKKLGKSTELVVI